uniref:Reverse transcriptase Ty1/copia-type domain-containing protein n=1 Tax=Nicotiana tabacum TaxID=4097 RepID=A0A1S4CFJ7_TOBAC|nr:PREDICTED: uncharacterized protein LOC107818273 [Nicotiana tabacum]
MLNQGKKVEFVANTTKVGLAGITTAFMSNLVDNNWIVDTSGKEIGIGKEDQGLYILKARSQGGFSSDSASKHSLPALYHLKVFGSLCYATNVKKTDKFCPRAISVVHLGYSNLVSDHVPSSIAEETSSSLASSVVSFPPYSSVSSPSSSTSSSSSQPVIQPAMETLKRSSRSYKPLVWMQDYVVQSKLPFCSCHISFYVCYDHLSPAYKASLNAYSAVLEPSSYAKACKDPLWVNLMKAKIAVLEENQTWTIVDFPQGKTPIDCKWVFKIKYKSKGEVKIYKARLVAKGYSQQEGLDYTETFSHVAKIVIMRSVVALAAGSHWSIFQMDVRNAFLQGDLSEEVFM